MKLTAQQTGLLGMYVRGRTQPDPTKVEEMATQLLSAIGRPREDIEYPCLSPQQMRERRREERPSTGRLEHYSSGRNPRTGLQFRYEVDPGRKRIRKARRPSV
jgi:hypothetical protein